MLNDSKKVRDYTCKNCNKLFNPPHHCGKLMEPSMYNGEKHWLCWKGDHEPCCGRDAFEPLEDCCDNQDLEAHFVEALNLQ